MEEIQAAEIERLKRELQNYKDEEKLFDERMEALDIPQKYVGYDNAQTIKNLLKRVRELETIAGDTDESLMQELANANKVYSSLNFPMDTPIATVIKAIETMKEKSEQLNADKSQVLEAVSKFKEIWTNNLIKRFQNEQQMWHFVLTTDEHFEMMEVLEAFEQFGKTEKLSE